MNKKQFQRVKALYRDGVTIQVCVTSIMEMSRSDFEAAAFIERFYNEMVMAPVQDELLTVKLELLQWQKIEERIHNYESLGGETETNLDDQRSDEGDGVS